MEKKSLSTRTIRKNFKKNRSMKLRTCIFQRNHTVCIVPLFNSLQMQKRTVTYTTYQNWAYTSCVDDDIEASFLSEQNSIRKKSGNCGTQYKSRKVSGHTKEKAITSGKTWILYYGPSSLRKEIINNDFCWSVSAQLVALFYGQRMQYKEVTLNEIESQPKPVGRNEARSM